MSGGTRACILRGVTSWHAFVDGKRYVASSTEEVLGWIRGGRVGPETPVWTEGMADWAPAARMPDLRDAFAAAPTAPTPAAPAPRAAAPATSAVAPASPAAAATPDLAGAGEGLRWTVRHRPSYASLAVDLEGGSIRTEAGAMVSMTDGIASETKIVGGLALGLVRKLLGGESLFSTTFSGRGRLVLAPSMIGDVLHVPLRGPLLAQRGAFLAAAPGVSFAPVWGGCRSFLGGAGAFLLRFDGAGDLFLGAYGAVVPLPVDGEMVVDTGHVVAFEPTLQYTLRGVGGWKSTLLSGEGIVFVFRGTGRVWLQSRNLGALVSWLSPFLPA